VVDFPRHIGATSIELLEIRGEIYATIDQFEHNNQLRESTNQTPHVHPRHMAAAIMRTEDIATKLPYELSLVAFDIFSHSATNELLTQSEIVAKLQEWGFETPLKSQSNVSISNVLGEVNSFPNWRSSLPFPTDGMVIKLENRNLQHQAGATSRFPRW